MAKKRTSPRERIEQTAYELFTRHGVRAVGVDTIVARSGVAKMTLYRHYPSKDRLALEFLRRRRDFSRGWQAEVQARNLSPEKSLLAVFDALEKWYRQRDYAGCPVIKVLLETEGSRGPLRDAAHDHFTAVRQFLRQLAEEAGVRDPEDVARQLHMLIWGSIIAACDGDGQAALRARRAAQAILAAEKPRRYGRARRPTR